MTQSTSTYTCFLVFLICFTASVINDKIDPEAILLSFPYCNAPTRSIQCVIKDTDCIQNTYNQMKKDKTETTVYIQGYQENTKVIPDYLDIILAYCSQNNSVIAILDWSKLTSGDLLLIPTRLDQIGQIVASTFNSLNNKGYEIAKWHLIGHSTGAHIAGCIGTYSNFTFSHITALEPAAVLFYNDLYKGCVMNPTVAHFTDAFYTNRGALSLVQNVGNLNIYANSGTAPQPGCYSNTSSYIDIHDCSHIKALKWYADAVRNETKYLATKCEDCMLFLRYKHCQENDQIYFGPHVDTKKTGLYCLPIN
ncbi:Pancreatic triacylglycerol lipase [Trachymyrmex septentrionalis]|uniref:phospholipase A1 n=1 Tax=Trachymyrmex septentrionalis TaxID=34720 RepID=A0A151JVN8_9HYME|nr:PREDICTED: pancreatic triacylglycerol lipase-like [Trachymyrmex septentrionalis]KYN37949.1 Pancreatic triacylglycerol lipase [Trachymyrmex septentrionalis]